MTTAWKRMLKWSAWLFGGLLLIPVICYVALLLINWRDQAPSEAALRLAADYRDRPAVADADNAYVYVMGFPVAPGTDPHEAGTRRIAWIQTFQPGLDTPPGDPVTTYDSHESSRSAVAQSFSACMIGSKECVAALESGNDELRAWIASEQWLLERYLTLVQHPDWRETLLFDPRAPLTFHGMLYDGQKLLLAQAYLEAGQNNAATVRELLGKDARFWRTVLASSDILITKMIAVASLKRTLITGNLILRRLPPDLQLAAVPEEWTLPLTDSERSMRRCLTGEWMWAGHLFEQTATSRSFATTGDGEDDSFDALMRRVWTPLLQPQDAKNRYAETFIRASQALDVPIDVFPHGLEQAREIFDNAHAANNPFANLYNPMGRVLLAIASGAYPSYPPRVADLEGVRRAAVLTTELRARKVAQQNIAAELAASPIRTPYTGEPFTWNAKEQAIVFVGMESSDRGRHAFKY